MIDIIIIIIFFVIYVMLLQVQIYKEISTFINLLLISSMVFYIALNITDINASKFFIILSVIIFILAPLSLILSYINKFR